MGLSRGYSYDPLGNIVAMTDRNGRVRTFEYDNLSRQTHERWLDSQGEVIRELTNTFDERGQLVAAADPTASYAYRYDGIGRLTRTTAVIPGLATPVALHAEYDEKHRRTEKWAEFVNQGADFRNVYEYDHLGCDDRVHPSWRMHRIVKMSSTLPLVARRAAAGVREVHAAQPVVPHRAQDSAGSLSRRRWQVPGMLLRLTQYRASWSALFPRAKSCGVARGTCKVGRFCELSQSEPRFLRAVRNAKTISPVVCRLILRVPFGSSLYFTCDKLEGGTMDAIPRSFQFGLRDLFWAVLVIALAVGWQLDRGKLRQEVAEIHLEKSEVSHLLEAARAQVSFEQRRSREAERLEHETVSTPQRVVRDEWLERHGLGQKRSQ